MDGSLSSTESGMSARANNVTVSSTFKSSFRMSFTLLFLPLVILLSAELCPRSKFHLLTYYDIAG